MDEELEFEWDEAKRLANYEKHGIDFETIAPAFDDPRALHLNDRRFDYGEIRVIMLADWRGTLLNVVYTLRDGRTRLISARRANRNERIIYERN